MARKIKFGDVDNHRIMSDSDSDSSSSSDSEAGYITLEGGTTVHNVIGSGSFRGATRRWESATDEKIKQQKCCVRYVRTT